MKKTHTSTNNTKDKLSLVSYYGNELKDWFNQKVTMGW